MAQAQPDKTSLEQVLRLVEKLPLSEQEQLRLQLNGRAWGREWDALSKKIQDKFRADGTSIPTEDEVMAEVKAVKKQREV
jgi:hypothetical protein